MALTSHHICRFINTQAPFSVHITALPIVFMFVSIHTEVEPACQTKPECVQQEMLNQICITHLFVSKILDAFIFQAEHVAEKSIYVS